MALTKPIEILGLATDTTDVTFSNPVDYIYVTTDIPIYVAGDATEAGTPATGVMGQRVFVPGGGTKWKVPWGKRTKVYIEKLDTGDTSTRILIEGV